MSERDQPSNDKRDEYLALLTEFETLVLDANDTQLPRHAQLPVSKRLNEVRARLQVVFAPSIQSAGGSTTDAFSRLASLIEDIDIDRYGKPLRAALHLCNDLADEVSSLQSARTRTTKETSMKINVNGEQHEFDPHSGLNGSRISYESVVTLAGYDAKRTLSVVYSTPRKGDVQRSGSLCAGDITQVEDGMRFTVADTGSA